MKQLILALALVALTALSAMAATPVVNTTSNSTVMIAADNELNNPAQYVLAGQNQVMAINKAATAPTYTSMAANAATNSNAANYIGTGNKETANVIKPQNVDQTGAGNQINAANYVRAVATIVGS